MLFNLQNHTVNTKVCFTEESVSIYRQFAPGYDQLVGISLDSTNDPPPTSVKWNQSESPGGSFPP